MPRLKKKGTSNLDTLPNVVMVEPSNAELVSVKKHARTTRNTKNKRRPLKEPIELSADQQELVNIKNSLGLRHQDYAILLGIGLPRLSSYTYGRTASVPVDVMKTARELLAENAEATRLLKEKFNRPMAEILLEWESKLGTSSDAELAGLIGVVTMTINRWRKNETKPDLSALNRYDRIVNLVVNNIRQLVSR